jgi:hypothetical protein
LGEEQFICSGFPDLRETHCQVQFSAGTQKSASAKNSAEFLDAYIGDVDVYMLNRQIFLLFYSQIITPPSPTSQRKIDQ